MTHDQSHSSSWQSRPVFITSTFRDMQAERDWLHNHVFPELEERLRERFHHLEAIDLRWGVDSGAVDEEQRETVVLTVCLREIERSRPFLIGLLGDRYGWQPTAPRITSAAREAGLDDDVAGKSVTELEIIYGVLRSADQQRRSWFYLRDPLPYDSMPPAVASRYSDLHSGEPAAAESARQLTDLKTRLGNVLPGRVRRYSATWNAATQTVTGLQAWGRQVLDDLWSDLEVATAAFLREAPRTWQDQDRWTLGEFIEGRVRDFVGRASLTEKLVATATSSDLDSGRHGLCITAEPGAGKSSLFGHLHRSLQKTDVVLLAHAAGISVRSTQVDWMLRRWVGELAHHLDQTDPLSDQSTPDDIDQAFLRLLHLSAQRRRVVILIDALNQFEPTTRATHLTWLPKLWPANARLIATAVTGVQSAALLNRPGFAKESLTPIASEEALQIVRRICARYHRTLNEQVEAALLAKTRPDGASAFGNPLWLQLATEELNLLGSEAFERVEEGTGAHGIVRLLTSITDQMPSDVEGLYGWMLDRAERNFGRTWTCAFVNVIAVSRAGWRESDLRELMPTLSGEAWDPLRFATLRRAFRAHVVQRGVKAQWDFAHAQMRVAINNRVEDVQPIHRALADHLRRLPADDPLHESETMLHLMELTDLREAAEYYGGQLTFSEADHATTALASLAVRLGATHLAALLDQLVDDSTRARIGERFLFELDAKLEHVAPLRIRQEISRSLSDTFTALAAVDAGNVEWQHDLSISHLQLGDSLVGLGELREALASFQASLAVAERLAGVDPTNPRWQHDVSISRNKIGDALAALGDLPAALMAFQASFAILKRLADNDPGHAQWQRDLSVGYERLGSVLAAQGDLSRARTAFQTSLAMAERLATVDPRNVSWQRDLSVAHSKLGDVLSAGGHLPAAGAAFGAAQEILERLTAADPSNAEWLRDLRVNRERLGDVLTAQGDLSEALTVFQANLATSQQLATVDPGNTVWQRDLSVSHKKLGEVLAAQGDLPGARMAFQASLAIVEGLSATDPRNVGWQHDISVSHIKLGDVLTAQGDLPEASVAFRESIAVLERLATTDASNAACRHELAATHNRLGDVLLAQGDLSGARAAFREAYGILERLTAAGPSNAGWQSDLAVSHGRLGDVLMQQGDFSAARAAFQASLAIRQRLATVDATNAAWQHDMAVSHIRLGDALTGQGNLSEAHVAFRAARATLERLSADDPSNAAWQRSLSTGQARVGKVLAAQGDLPRARIAFHASLGVCPSNRL